MVELRHVGRITGCLINAPGQGSPEDLTLIAIKVNPVSTTKGTLYYVLLVLLIIHYKPPNSHLVSQEQWNRFIFGIIVR